MKYELTPAEKKARMDKAERMHALRKPMRPYTIGSFRHSFRKVDERNAGLDTLIAILMGSGIAILIFITTAALKAAMTLN